MTCSDCVLGTLQMQLNSPFSFDEDLAKTFSSITSSYGSTNYPFIFPVPSSTTAVQVNNSATSTASHGSKCSSYYQIAEGDDCSTISKAKNVSTFSLLVANNLEQSCTYFPGVGFKLCIPESCNVYTVQDNDTCFGIAFQRNYEFSITQLISWNPNINKHCSNLSKLNGTEICISYPGSSGIDTSPPPPILATTAPAPSNVVAGTNRKCAKYYEIQAQDNCALVTMQFAISLMDFYFLNPKLNSTDCSNLQVGYSYCVQAVGNIHTYSGYNGGGGGATAAADPCMAATAVPSSCFATDYLTTTPLLWPTMTTAAVPPPAPPQTPGTDGNHTGY